MLAGSGFAVAQNAPKGLPPRHPMMHGTRTHDRSLDYAIIMSGEIDMLMDEGEVHLKAGDVFVQQATNHTWVNRDTAPCRIAFILIVGSIALVTCPLMNGAHWRIRLKCFGAQLVRRSYSLK